MMRKTTVAFFATTVTLALFVASKLPVEGFTRFGILDWVGLGAFIIVAILSERLALDFGTGKQASSSIAFLPFIACALLFDITAATLVVAVTVAVSSILISRLSAPKALFNISQGVISIAAAAYFYSAFFAPAATDTAIRGRIDIVGAFALAFVFFAINILLSSIAIALLRDLDFADVMGTVIGPRGGNLWYDLLASPVAIIQAELYREHHAFGILMILLPLLLVRYSYLSKMQLEEANRDLLKVLVKAIETRDPYTSGHSLRVATLARTIATALQLSKRRIEDIETAALLHDIGKIDLVFEGMLRKPHALSEYEREVIRTHAAKGAELLESLSSVPKSVIQGVRHHHERYDGTGYPSRLKGESIPLSARIIMLCDSIDAMLSDRPYRKALPIAAVEAELQQHAGTQFDPAIVDVIVNTNALEHAVRLIRAEQLGWESQASRGVVLAPA